MFESVKMNETQKWNVNLVKSKAEELLDIITKYLYKVTVIDICYLLLLYEDCLHL